MADHGDWRTRAEVAYALGRIGDQRASPALLELLADSVGVVRAQAAGGFEHIRDPAAVSALTAALGDPYFVVRDGAQAALVAIGEGGVGALVDVLDDPSASPLARRVAAGALARSDAEMAREPLFRATTADDWVIRLRAAEGLARRACDGEARERLRAMAADSHPLVRRRVRRALAELGQGD